MLQMDVSADRVIARRHSLEEGEDMKAHTWIIASTFAAAASISGCATSPTAQQRATAFAIGGTAVAPEEIKISDKEVPFMSLGKPVVRWHASTPTGEYDCSGVQSGELLLQPVCAKK
jgi:hypothetical protein